MMEGGRLRFEGRFWQLAKNACPRGHAYDITYDGRRRCSICIRANARARYGRLVGNAVALTEEDVQSILVSAATNRRLAKRLGVKPQAIAAVRQQHKVAA